MTSRRVPLYRASRWPRYRTPVAAHSRPGCRAAASSRCLTAVAPSCARSTGRPGAPTVVLLHGWMASGALNWYQAFDTLGEHYHVLAPDHRGHARGLRTRRRFRLADCADDVAAICRELGVDEAIAVGYSMGGPIAQLFWHRHRDLCSGLVLGATAAGFIPGVRERIVFTSMMSAAVSTTRLGELAMHMPLVPPSVRPILARSTGRARCRNWAAREFRRHDWRMLMEAGHSIGTYHASWIGEHRRADGRAAHDARHRGVARSAAPHGRRHPHVDGARDRRHPPRLRRAAASRRRCSQRSTTSPPAPTN